VEAGCSYVDKNSVDSGDFEFDFSSYGDGLEVREGAIFDDDDDYYYYAKIFFRAQSFKLMRIV
jgi:hypothetical protein